MEDTINQFVQGTARYDVTTKRVSIDVPAEEWSKVSNLVNDSIDTYSLTPGHSPYSYDEYDSGNAVSVYVGIVRTTKENVQSGVWRIAVYPVE